MRPLLALLACSLFAQVRPVPPPGIEIPAAERKTMEAGLARLDAKIRQLGAHPLLVDVKVFSNAVDWALRYGEFYKADEFAKARDLLRAGEERADALLRGTAPWTTATGLVVRGYVSKIDASIQPYGLVIPEKATGRLDTWFHGRGETLSMVNFIADRLTKPGEFTPPGAMVLHLYGRYCNANKFAGEVDLFEALDDVKRHYRVDENRIVVRGFSMGGAATWHIAAHHAGLWAAAAPGAGFAETPLYLGLGKKEPMPPAWEQTLWRWYDAPFYAANLRNLPVVAYSGEKDRQKQAADVMAEAMAREGVTLRHVIGPDTEHRYHPQSKIEIEAAISALAEAGRDPYPRRLTFATHTLRYDRMKWIRIDALDKHWEEARVEASIADDGTVSLTTKNVAALTLEFGPAGWPFAPGVAAKLRINGQPVSAPPVLSDRSWRASLRREGTAWKPFDGKWPGLRKVHGLTGPIDDALMDRFVFVRPTGPNPSAWALAEMERAAREWRRQMKGEPRIKNDTEITEADIREANLVLWGEPSSNQVLGRIAGELPIAWSSLGGGESLVMIYPNPLNPKRYVVLNSGLTWREPDYLSNARQTPKLPDWAVVDTGTAAVRRAGFFDEQWRYTEKH